MNVAQQNVNDPANRTLIGQFKNHNHLVLETANARHRMMRHFKSMEMYLIYCALGAWTKEHGIRKGFSLFNQHHAAKLRSAGLTYKKVKELLDTWIRPDYIGGARKDLECFHVKI